MNYKIEWDNTDKTVILQQYFEGAIKDDLYHLATKSKEMLASVSHKVHLIIDERAINLVLNSADIKFLEKNVPENQGYVVMIPPAGSLGYKKMVQNMARRLAPRAFHEPYFASSLEEAREILQEIAEVSYR